jgi:hypothetical protein
LIHLNEANAALAIVLLPLVLAVVVLFESLGSPDINIVPFFGVSFDAHQVHGINQKVALDVVI